MVPVLNEAMLDGIVDRVALGMLVRFVPDVKVQIINPSLARQVAAARER